MLMVLAALPFVAAWLQGTPSPASGGDTTGSNAPPEVLASANSDAVPTLEVTNAIAPAPATLPPGMQLYPGTQEVVKMAQAGIGDDVMLAYITNSAARFGVTSDEIIYLNDLGVSGAVVTAMMQHDAAENAATPNAPAGPVPTNPSLAGPLTPATAPPPGMEYTNPPPLPDEMATIPPPGNTNYTDEAGSYPGDYPPPDDTGYFYNSLLPYGSWIYVAGCGVCWQPTVCLRDRAWRPYCDRGRWLYSNCGWYWQSDYSWGWAAFHYGRWFCDSQRGWVWHPDLVWGPSWVAWRGNQNYCGWAPLPPSAVFTPGSGFHVHNQAVSASSGFGLSSGLFMFIPIERVGDFAPSRYAVSPWQNGSVFKDSKALSSATIINQRVANLGIDPRIVDQRAGVRVRRAMIQEVNGMDANGRVQPDRLAQRDGSLVILRPQLPPAPAHSGIQSSTSFGTSATRTAFGSGPARTPTVLGVSGASTMQPATGTENVSHVHVYYVSHEDPRPANTVSWYQPPASQNATTRPATTATYPANSLVMEGRRTVAEPQWNSTPGQPQPGAQYYNYRQSSSSSYSVTPGTPAGEQSPTAGSSRVIGGRQSAGYQYYGNGYYRPIATATVTPGAGTYSEAGYNNYRQAGYAPGPQESSYRAEPQPRENYSAPAPRETYSAPQPHQSYSAPSSSSSSHSSSSTQSSSQSSSQQSSQTSSSSSSSSYSSSSSRGR